MERSIDNHCNVRPVFGIQDVGMLHVSLVAIGLDADAVAGQWGSGSRVLLPSRAVLVQESQAAVEDIVALACLPAVL